MVVCQDEDVGHHQADHYQGLQGDKTSQVVNFSKGVAAGAVTVTKIMEDHDNNHKNSIANRKDIERSSANVLGADIELKISLK